MNIGGYLDAKNSENLAKWRWCWHLQGGSRYWMARSLQDLRNDEDLRRWRVIEHKRRRTGKGGTIVNLAARRIARALKRIRA